MNKVALFVALAMALVGSLLLFVYLRRFEQEASGGARVKLVVAVKPIAVGQTLSDDMLATREVPQAYVEDRAVRDTERSRIVGLRVATPLQAQQTLMWTDMAVATDYRRDLSGLVQAGLRAVSVRATTDGSFTLIRPGDRVDVIATLAQGQDQRQDQRESVVLLQNVLVLAVGLDMGNDPLAKGQPHQDRNDQILTLSVNIPETQLLALASEKGRLTVAVRNPDDIRVAEGLSDMSSTTLTDTKSRTAVQAVRKTGPVRLESGGTVQ